MPQGAAGRQRAAGGRAGRGSCWRLRLFRLPQNPSHVQFTPHGSHVRLTECTREVFTLHETGPPHCAS